MYNLPRRFSSTSDFAFISLEDDDKINLKKLTPILLKTFKEILELFVLNYADCFDIGNLTYIIISFKFPIDRNDFLKVIYYKNCPRSLTEEDCHDLVEFSDVDYNEVYNEFLAVKKLF